MATYVNNLRLKEIATGDESGTWGTSTNTNLELIADSLGYNTQDGFSTDADATTTVADGTTDPARAMYFKVTSSATLTATRTLTIAPNTISRVMWIENATTGSQSINISQGSGANVTIESGATKVVYLDGAGASAAVVDAMANLDQGTGEFDTIKVTNIQANDGTASSSIADSTGVMTIASSVLTTADINGGTIDGTTVGATTASTGNFSTLSINGTAITSTAAELNILDGVTANSAEINILDGCTADTTELNILDGVTATTAELNILDGVTATTAELNYSDGVTSNIQTQLDTLATVPAVGTKTGSYTLTTSDTGKYVQVGSGGSITIPDATFSEGDVVNVFNNTTGDVTITCSITTAYITGADSDVASVTLATRGLMTIFFISGTVCVMAGSIS